MSPSGGRRTRDSKRGVAALIDCRQAPARRARATSIRSATYRGSPHLSSLKQELLDVDAGDCAADHQALDLRGPLEDRVDLGVAVHPLDRELAGVAVAAEDL